MKKILLNAWGWLGAHWRGVVVTILVAGLSIATLGLQLNTLIDGHNQLENVTLERLSVAPQPWERAVNTPYYVPAYIVGKVIGDPLVAARVISVFYALAATACLFFVIKFWFNVRYATIGALLFITSSWVLHISHLASPLILLVFAPLFVLAGISWFWRTKSKTFLAFMTVVASLVFAAHVPYMLWLIGIGVIFLATLARQRLRHLKLWHVIVASVFGLAFSIPLILSLVAAPGQILELLGIYDVVSSVGEYFSNLAWTISQLFFISEPLPYLHLGKLPLLDIFSSAMFVLGLYYYATRWRHRRSVMLFSSTLILLLLVPLTKVYQLSSAVLLPVVFIFVISGIVEFVNQWLSYFPRNPWARTVGISLIVVAIGLTSFYHLQRYFIAWPQAPATTSSYTTSVDEP